MIRDSTVKFSISIYTLLQLTLSICVRVAIVILCVHVSISELARSYKNVHNMYCIIYRILKLVVVVEVNSLWKFSPPSLEVEIHLTLPGWHRLLESYRNQRTTWSKLRGTLSKCVCNQYNATQQEAVPRSLVARYSQQCYRSGHKGSEESLILWACADLNQAPEIYTFFDSIIMTFHKITRFAFENITLD